MHPRQTAHARGNLLDGHGSAAVAGISSPGPEILHHQHEVVVGLVDERGIDGGVLERQFRPAGEQPRLMEHATGQADQCLVCGFSGLDEDRRRSRTGLVADAQPSTSVGAVVAKLDGDRVDRDARKVRGQRRRHPRRRDLIPGLRH